MRAFTGGALAAVLVLVVLWFPTIAPASEPKSTVDFVHNLYLGAAGYSFYSCSPSCGKQPSSTGMFGFSETFYWTGRKVHPGVQVGYLRTTSMHVREPGEINDELVYGLFMLRGTLPNGVKVYGGIGVGGQFTQIVLSDRQSADCNHRADIIKIGAEYPLTQRTGIGLEYLRANTRHDFEADGNVGGEELKVKQRTQSIMATLAFHF